ncbi:M48 family metalloprotease [bacterium]|nr:M48 family metalloprotease [bacterium]
MNAFATGRRTSDSWIVFTSGLLERLDKREIEAVAGHELTHIINKDSLLMLTAVIFVGVISLLGEILVRTGSRNNNNKGNILPLIGL